MALAVSSFPTKAQESIPFPSVTADTQRGTSKSGIRSFFRPQERNLSSSPISSSSSHNHSISALTHSAPVKSSSGRVTFEDVAPASACSRPCCRRCGRQIPPGGKRSVAALTDSVDEVTKDVAMQPASPRIIAEPITSRDHRAAMTSPHIPVVARPVAPVARPTSTFSHTSELVERTKGIMASLSPAHETLSTRSLSPPDIKRAPARSTLPKTERSNALSLYVSASMPNKREHRGRNTYPPLHEVRSTTNLPDELGWRDNKDYERPLSRIASPDNLSIGRLTPPLPSKIDVDNMSLNSTLQVRRRPLYLDLPLSDSASVFSMSEFLGSIFSEKSSPESKLDTDHEEDFLQSDSALLDLRIPPEYPCEPTTPMVFSDDCHDRMEEVSGRHLGKKYKSWNARARKGSRKHGKLTVRWTPLESWGEPEDPVKPHLDGQSSNMSSQDKTPPLKPLTYLIHHKNTSSVDVCSSGDHQDGKKTSITTESEESGQTPEESRVMSEEDGVMITTRQPRQPRQSRKSVWQESAVLEVIPRLRELKVAKNRR